LIGITHAPDANESTNYGGPLPGSRQSPANFSSLLRRFGSKLTGRAAGYRSSIQSVLSQLRQRSNRRLLPSRLSRIDCGAARPPQCLQVCQNAGRRAPALSGLLLMKLLVASADWKRGKLQGEVIQSRLAVRHMKIESRHAIAP